MKKLRIYLDTSVINFVYADDAPEKRDATLDFFRFYVATKRYYVAISAVVLAEIEQTSDFLHRQKLLDIITEYGIAELAVDPQDEVTMLAEAYIEQGVLPATSYEDSLHVALCTVNEIDVLLSWNYKHLANVNKERKIIAVNQANGYLYPLRIVTPLEVMEDG